MPSFCFGRLVRTISRSSLPTLFRETVFRATLNHQNLQCSRALTFTWGFVSSPSGIFFCVPQFRQFTLSSGSYFHVSWPEWQRHQPDMAEQRYCVEYAKRGTAGCKKCKDKIMKGLVRIGKIVPNPFSESAGEMKEWYHVKCIFEKLERARATTKKIEDITELEGWEELQDEDKDLINKHVSGIGPLICSPCLVWFRCHCRPAICWTVCLPFNRTGSQNQCNPKEESASKVKQQWAAVSTASWSNSQRSSQVFWLHRYNTKRACVFFFLLLLFLFATFVYIKMHYGSNIWGQFI